METETNATSQLVVEFCHWFIKVTYQSSESDRPVGPVLVRHNNSIESIALVNCGSFELSLGSLCIVIFLFTNIKIIYLLNEMEKMVRRRRRTVSEGTSRSLKLKYLVHCLVTNKHSHVLYWSNQDELEFKIKFVHKGNSEKWNEKYLDLFRDFDKLSLNKMIKYEKDEKYESSCKSRFRSNIFKFCNSAGPLIFKGEEKQGKSVTIKTFRFKSDEYIRNCEDISLEKALKIKMKQAKKQTRKCNLDKEEECSLPMEFQEGAAVVESNSDGTAEESTQYPCVSNMLPAVPFWESSLMSKTSDMERKHNSSKMTYSSVYGPSDQLIFIVNILKNANDKDLSQTKYYLDLNNTNDHNASNCLMTMYGTENHIRKTVMAISHLLISGIVGGFFQLFLPNEFNEKDNIQEQEGPTHADQNSNDSDSDVVTVYESVKRNIQAPTSTQSVSVPDLNNCQKESGPQAGPSDFSDPMNNSQEPEGRQAVPSEADPSEGDNSVSKENNSQEQEGRQAVASEADPSDVHNSVSNEEIFMKLFEDDSVNGRRPVSDSGTVDLMGRYEEVRSDEELRFYLAENEASISFNNFCYLSEDETKAPPLLFGDPLLSKVNVDVKENVDSLNMNQELFSDQLQFF